MNRTVKQIKKEIEQAEAKINELAAPSEYPGYSIRAENGNRGKDGKPIFDENHNTWSYHQERISELRRELEDVQRKPMSEEEAKRVDYFNQAAEDYDND